MRGDMKKWSDVGRCVGVYMECLGDENYRRPCIILLPYMPPIWFWPIWLPIICCCWPIPPIIGCCWPIVPMPPPIIGCCCWPIMPMPPMLPMPPMPPPLEPLLAIPEDGAVVRESPNTLCPVFDGLAAPPPSFFVIDRLSREMLRPPNASGFDCGWASKGNTRMVSINTQTVACTDRDGVGTSARKPRAA